MSYQTLPIAYGPVFPVEREQTPKLNIAQFGDGYEQASGDGINIFRPTVQVKWEGLTSAEGHGLDDFIKGLNGITPFMWTYPGDPAPSQWVCRKWKLSFVASGPAYEFSADFLQSFNP